MPNQSVQTLHLGLLFLSSAFAISATGCLPESPKTASAGLQIKTPAIEEFPARPAGQAMGSGITKYSVRLTTAGKPGHNSRVWVYLPASVAETVPCVVYVPAGATVYNGISLSTGDESLILPLAAQGFAVVAHEVDGALKDIETATQQQLVSAAEAYVASSAGLVNARNALDFTLATFPEIDPARVFAFGHSSGGKQSLLWTAHEPRVRGCVALAPAVEIGTLESLAIKSQLSTSKRMSYDDIARSMPSEHTARIKVPTLLVHSENDRVVRSRSVKSFARKLGSHGKALEIKSESHFDIPEKAYGEVSEWLCTQAEIEYRESINFARFDRNSIANPSPEMSARQREQFRSASGVDLSNVRTVNLPGNSVQPTASRNGMPQQIRSKGDGSVRSNPYLK